MAEPQAAMDDFLHGGQISDMTEEINILKKKMRELEGKSTGSTATNVVLYKTGVAVTIAAIETTILSFTVPGGTLGTTGIIDIILRGIYNANGTGAQTLTIKLKYGATTLLTNASAGWRDTASDGSWEAHLYLLANAAANSQRGWLLGTGTQNDGGNIWHWCIDEYGTSAEDSTVDKTLVITAQKTAAATISLQAGWAVSL